MSSRWIGVPVPPAAETLRTAGFESPLAELLAQRGLADPDAANRFLRPRLEALSASGDLAGLHDAAERLAEAVRRKEVVLVVGDYDVDGVTATALVAATIEALGGRVETLLPRRDQEGYGLQPTHLRRASERRAALVVVVDSGTTATEAWDEAERLGIDLIVIDHHLPAATAEIPPTRPGRWLVNPRLSGGPPAALDSTAAGLAARLAATVFERAGRPVPWDGLLRLAALGTIADVAPLTGDNRIVAALGLAALGSTPSPGLRELKRRSSIRGAVAAGDVAFRLAPRLNAAGRLADAAAALELLLTRDAARAASLAAQLDAWNSERQSIERRMLAEARERLAVRGELPWIVVLSSATWHRGVVGVAAARLAREIHRPTILLAEEGDEAVGSGRSVAGLPLHELIAPSRAELRRFGGHAQAIGLTVESSRLDELRGVWESAAERWRDRLTTRELRYDFELRPARVTEALAVQIDSLAPFGAGNSEPLFRIGPCRLGSTPIPFGHGHLRFAVAAGPGTPIQAVAWDGVSRWGHDLPGELELLAAVERDLRGQMRLRVVDLRGLGPAND